MSENIIFGFDNAADRATSLVASSELAAMPDGNLQRYDRWRVWRSAAAGTVTVDVTLAPTEETVLTLALVLDHNITDTGTIRLQGWTDAIAGANEVVDVTVSPWANFYGYGGSYYGVGGYGEGGLPLSQVRQFLRPLTALPLPSWLAAASNRYWRFTFSDAALSYYQASRIYIGSHFQPKWNIDYGWNVAFKETNRYRESHGLQQYGNPIDVPREMSFDLSWLEDAERDAMLVHMYQNGTHKPFFVIPRNTDNAENLVFGMYGRFSQRSMSPRYASQNKVPLRIVEHM